MTEKENNDVVIAIHKNDVNEIKRLITSDKYKIVEEHGMTALHEASWTGRDAIIDELIKSGVELNGKNKQEGNTPLHFAALYGHATSCQKLVNAGADKKIKNNAGLTPYELAQKFGRNEVLPIVEIKK